MFKRAKFQNGSLTREKRKSGPAIWIFRYRDHDGKHRKVRVGTVEEYRTKAAAQRATEHYRVNINKESYTPRTVEQLVTHYQEKELSETGSKSYSTRAAYRCYINNWILPQWGEYPIHQVKTVAVETWLAGLAITPGSKSKIRNLMSAIFNHAMRYEWLEKNPITLVRQSGKRQTIPELLDVQEIQSLLSELREQPYRTIVFLAVVTGLRISELLALQWQDIDFKAGEINLTRGIVHQHVGTMKTEASRKPVPLAPALADTLREWKNQTPYKQPEDWLFASPEMNGKQPLWPENILRRYVRPAAERAKIKKRIGFHTFRHSYGTLLEDNGEGIKTIQELMRHANSRITIDTYLQATTPAKRGAQNRVVTMISKRAEA